MHIYDKDWYLNNYKKIGEMDADDFFNPLDRIREYLRSESKKFVGKIKASDLEHIISQSLDKFNLFFIKMFRYVLIEAVECAEYANILKTDSFIIYTGELYGNPEILYRDFKNKIDFEELNDSLSSKKTCKAYDLRNKDFTNSKFINSDFRYTDFRNSCLNLTNLSNSILEGVMFNGCKMADSILRHTHLSEASFQNADLRRADMTMSVSLEGVWWNDELELSGNFPLNLYDADMSDAILDNSFFVGVDFTRTKLDGASFTGASVFNCKFKKTQLSNINLTEEQRSQIIMF